MAIILQLSQIHPTCHTFSSPTVMPIEIERKFLVQGDRWRSLANGIAYRQGYVATERGNTVRVRIVGDRGWLTVKGPTTHLSRAEYEYEIPHAEALAMLDTLCQPPLIEKIRHTLELDGLTWEIDEFLGANQGLILAEVELENETQAIALPDWIGAEVSQDPRYYNANLAKVPYRQWQSSTPAW